MEFKHALGASLAIAASGETGEVIGRADYAHSEPSYYLRYRAADGRATEAWWPESALCGADLQTPAQPAPQCPNAAAMGLQPGERYAGLVLNADGAPSHHLVLLPGEAENITWPNAKDWAAKAGGELPTRQEQALLYANLKAEFQPRWYWSAEEHESNGSYAWGQHFHLGSQYVYRKSYEGRARAVRRFPA